MSPLGLSIVRMCRHTYASCARTGSCIRPHLALPHLATAPAHPPLCSPSSFQAWQRTWRRAYQLREEVLAGKGALGELL